MTERVITLYIGHMPTQAERKATTRQALLDAAADLIVEEGLAGFTTTAVTQRADMSNGALFSHFPTRLELLAATVEHVLTRLRDDYEAAFDRLVEHGASPEALLDLLWESMSDPQFCAVIAVYTQSRTDGELLVALHDVVVEHGAYVGALNQRVARTFTDDPSVAARLYGLGTIAILAMQGLVVSNMVGASIGSERDLIGAFADLYEHSRHQWSAMHGDDR